MTVGDNIYLYCIKVCYNLANLWSNSNTKWTFFIGTQCIMLGIILVLAATQQFQIPGSWQQL